MARLTNQQKDLSGVFEFKDWIVEELPYFLYELSIHKYWKNGFCVLGTKFFTSKKLLNFKQVKKIKQFKGYKLEKEITLLGVPKEFIEKYNLKAPVKKTKKKKK